ncbi:hypothetical protein AAMO2058_000252600 [Amorphochlora amoebiformis]
MATSSCPAAPTLSRALEAFSRIQNMPLTQFYNDVWQKSCEERLNASEEKLEKPEGVGVDMPLMSKRTIRTKVKRESSGISIKKERRKVRRNEFLSAGRSSRVLKRRIATCILFVQ